MIKRIIFFLLAALLAGNAAACGREERNVSPSEDAAPVREKAKEDSLIPGKPSQIPQKYFEESEHPGTLAELNYDTYESMTYEDHAQVLHKRAIVYLPYGYSEDKSYNVSIEEVMNMQFRILGNSGLRVSSVGLGCMGITHASGAPMNKAEGARVIREAYEMGYTFFDTAECYTGVYPDGATVYNEEIVGDALRPVRDKVIIATKCGVRHGGDHLILDSSPETIRRSVEGSLRRLGIDCIDLYYQHRIDPKVEPEAVAETMAELIQEGKIRAWGISEANEDYLRRAHAVCPVAAIENRYSMMARWHETLFPVLEELGVAYVAFSPMANGFLTGRYNADSKFEQDIDFRSNMPQYTKEGFEKGSELLELLRTMATEKNATPAQISLAWMLCKKPYIIPIPGSRKPARLRENLGAAEIILSSSEVAAIDAKLDTMDLPVFGGRTGGQRLL